MWSWGELQPMTALAISLSKRRAGCSAQLNRLLSSTATFSSGICKRAISALKASGTLLSSSMNSNSMATRLITSSSASSNTRDLPLLTLTRVSSCSSWLRRSKSSSHSGSGTYCCRCDSRRSRSRLTTGCGSALASRVGATLPRTATSNFCKALNACWPLLSSGGSAIAWPVQCWCSRAARPPARRDGSALSSGNTPVAISNWLASPYNKSASLSTYFSNSLSMTSLTRISTPRLRPACRKNSHNRAGPNGFSGSSRRLPSNALTRAFNCPSAKPSR